jgi:Zn-dependent peptidase ImmA (M78 family)
MDERFANRMRFSFAHELGHFFLHKNFYATFVYGSVEEWKGIILSMPDTEHRNFEFQANEFAGRFLVPRSNLMHEIEVAIETLRRINMLEYLNNDADAVLSLISPQLARPFGVSTDVIETRVKREGLWPPELK